MYDELRKLVYIDCLFSGIFMRGKAIQVESISDFFSVKQTRIQDFSLTHAFIIIITISVSCVCIFTLKMWEY